MTLAEIRDSVNKGLAWEVLHSHASEELRAEMDKLLAIAEQVSGL